VIILDCEQRDESWFAEKAGRPSTSQFGEIITPGGAPSKQATKYLYTLAGERLIGQKAESWQNAAMARGVDLEGEARQFYEVVNDVEVKQVGLCFADEQKRFCSSPDGLVGEDGLLEIKCPTLPVAVEYLLNGTLPNIYLPQCQGQLFVTGRKWVDFLSYYPGLKPLILRVYWDNVFIVKLKRLLDDFCDELDAVTDRLRALQ